MSSEDGAGEVIEAELTWLGAVSAGIQCQIMFESQHGGKYSDPQTASDSKLQDDILLISFEAQTLNSLFSCFVLQILGFI